MKQVVWLDNDILDFWVVDSFNYTVVSLVSRGGGLTIFTLYSASPKGTTCSRRICTWKMMVFLPFYHKAHEMHVSLLHEAETQSKLCDLWSANAVFLLVVFLTDSSRLCLKNH